MVLDIIRFPDLLSPTKITLSGFSRVHLSSVSIAAKENWPTQVWKYQSFGVA